MKKRQTHVNTKLQTGAADLSDVDEDHEVVSMDHVEAPINIEFEMPKLASTTTKTFGEGGSDNEEEEVDRDSDDSGEDSGEEKEEEDLKEKTLTANDLNNFVVKMRGSVAKSKRFLSENLLRKRKRFEQAKTKTDKLEAKVTRINEEIAAIKELDNDEVSKFALLNTKTMDQLLAKVEESAKTRCMYRIVFEKPIVNDVAKYRKIFTDWKLSTPFVLQRLGLQYAGNKTMTVERLAKKREVDKLKKKQKRTADKTEKDKPVDIKNLTDVIDPKKMKLNPEAVIEKISLSSGGEIKLFSDKKKKPVFPAPTRTETEEMSDMEEDSFFCKPSANSTDSRIIPTKEEIYEPKKTKTLRNEISRERKKNKSKQQAPADELHPSWIAKKQLKDKLAAMPKSTRKVFDDDD